MRAKYDASFVALYTYGIVSTPLTFAFHLTSLLSSLPFDKASYLHTFLSHPSAVEVLFELEPSAEATQCHTRLTTPESGYRSASGCRSNDCGFDEALADLAARS